MTEDIEQQSIPQEPIPQPPTEISAPVQPESVIESAPIEQAPEPTQPEPVSVPASIPSQPQLTIASPKSFFTKALESIQSRKRAKLEKIMRLANEKKVITNDDVEKLLRVSDATATRYLNTLVKQNRLKVSGNRGSVRYEPTNGSIGGN